jgi:acetoin utilization protein AcuB
MKHSTHEIMSAKLVTIHYQAPVTDAYRLMKERNIRHLPVVDDEGQVVGLMSDRDVQRAMKPKKGVRLEESLSYEFDPQFEVKDFMSWPVRSVEESVHVVEVAQRMLSEKVSAFLVMSAHRHPVGIVTTDDLLRLLISLMTKEPGGLRHSLSSLLDEFGLRSNLGLQ